MIDFKEVAAQLRKPEGDFGKHIGMKMNESNHFMNMLTIEHLPLKPDSSVLEIGMGNGAFIKEIFKKENSVNYTGCDYSSTMIKEAEELNKDLMEDEKIKFIHSSSHNSEFQSSSFDLIFGVNTIYFWDDPKNQLQEFHRILKANGKLLISLRPERVMKELPFTPYGFTLYSKERVIDLLIENSFDIDKIIEQKEPPQELNPGVEMETLIILASKI